MVGRARPFAGSERHATAVVGARLRHDGGVGASVLVVVLASCGVAGGNAGDPAVGAAARRLSSTTTAVTTSTDTATAAAGMTRTSTPAGSRAAMVAAFTAGSAAYQRCMIDPARCDTAALARTYGGTALPNVERWVARLRAGHLRVRYPSPDTYYGVVEAATADAAVGSGTVTECGVDGGVLFQPIDGDPDGVIVNDQLVSSRDVWSMRLIDGAWKRVSYRNLVTWTGVNRCPARSA